MNFSFLNTFIEVDQNSPAIVTRNFSINYYELDKRLNNICSFLHNKGIREGSKAAIPGIHNSDFILMLLALWKMGAVPIPLNTRLSNNELKSLLDFASPEFFLYDRNYYKGILDIDSHAIPYPIENLPKAIQVKEENVDVNMPVIVIFTSGTSGIPKGVVLTIKNLLSSAAITNNILEPATGDSWLASLPFYHIGGIMVIVRALLSGLSVIIPESFDTANLKYFLDAHRPAFISLVPTVMKRLLENNVYPNSALKVVLLGGGPVNNELAVEAVSKGWNILKVYGASETCSMFTALHITKNTQKLSSAGLPLIGNTLKIVNEEHEEVPVGKAGEIAVSGPTIFKEYLNNESETRKKKDGNFYYTGDLGYVDDEGYLFIETRRTDLIISGGENISPTEIESALLKIPDIQQAFVLGIPDKEWGQIPVAVIKTSGIKDQAIIIAELRNVLASYKLPRKIYFMDEIPVNELGKVNREDLKKMME